MNRVILMGRLTADPDIRYAQGSGMTLASATLAVDRRDKEHNTDFIRIKAFDKRAEFFEKYAHKGTKLVISGRIQTGSYKDKEGKTVYTTDVVVDDTEFAESKSAQSESPTPAPQPKADADGFMSIPDNLADEGLPWN